MTGPYRRTGGGTDWERLRRGLRGDLVLPADAGYDAARRLESAQYDSVHPRAVAYCETERDVHTAVTFSRDNGLAMAVRSGGHSTGGYSTGEGLVLDVSRINQVRVTGRTVVVGAGTQQIDALTALVPHGLALVSGNCPTVCFGGFLQGGGIGSLTRGQGMGCDRLVAATVVLADGRVVRASAAEHPDLFWALRGNGGGNYGVVTRYELRPVRVATLVNYSLVWPWEQAKQVLGAYQQWTVGGSRQNGSTASVIDVDPGGSPPIVLVHGAWTGARADLDSDLDDLAAQVGAPPLNRTVEQLPYFDAVMQRYGCQDLSVHECHRIGYLPEAMLPRDNYLRTRNRMFGAAVPGDQVDRMLAAFAAHQRGGQFRLIEFFPLGGRANTPARADTAYVHRTAELLVSLTAGLTSPDFTPTDRAVLDTWIDEGFQTLNPNSLLESYQNYIDPVLPRWQRAYYGENYGRLVRVKRGYDPDNFFHFPQSIG